MPEALLSPCSSTVASASGNPFDLVCTCCTAKPGPEQAERIAGWQFADFDWQEFFRIAEHHGVLALTARNLLDHAIPLPAEIRRSLEAAYAANFRRGLWFAAELMRATRHLAQKPIRVIPYKGPVLAQAAYGDLALRSFNDLDLLIAPADFFLAKAALAEIGYSPSKPFTPAVERLWLHNGYECSFDGPAGKNLLEVQWALLPAFYAVDSRDLAFEYLWERAGRINLGETGNSGSPAGDAQVPCLSPEDSLLILSLHAAKHLWTRLIWIADIAESLRAPSLDFKVVVTRVREIGIARILGVSLSLANRLLGAELSPLARNLIERDSEIPRIVRDCEERLLCCGSYDFNCTGYFKQVRRLRERGGDRLRYLWRLAGTLGEGDIDAIRLPEIAFPLYRGVRLMRLARRFVHIQFL